MIIEKETLEWLCEEDNPPVRYLTLKNLLNKPDTMLTKEKAQLNEYSIIKKILKHNNTFWGKDKHLYRKYKGGYWQLIFLGDIFANGRNQIIKKGFEFILDEKKWHTEIDNYNTSGICLTANITRTMANLGYGDDSRVLDLTENIARSIVKNDGINCSVMDYSLLPQCHMALPKVLMALGSYSGKKRIVKQAIMVLSEKLLERNIYRYVPQLQKNWRLHQEEVSKKISDLKKRAKVKLTIKEQLAKDRSKFLKRNKVFTDKVGWLKFGYPLHYNSDILEAMRSLADAGVKYDSRMDNALDIIERKMMPDGRWKLEFSLNGKMWVDIEKRGKPSKWVTYHALSVLQRYGRRQLT